MRKRCKKIWREKYRFKGSVRDKICCEVDDDEKWNFSVSLICTIFISLECAADCGSTHTYDRIVV